jgi:predicted amidohydrolase
MGLLLNSHAAELGKLRVAACQFPVSATISANADWIEKQMHQAKKQGADIVHFPEAALPGYGGVDHKTFDGFDWEELRARTRCILSLADELNLWVLLGSMHQLSDGRKPHNSMYVINPEGKIIDRYDKRFCTGGDLRRYSPGDHFVSFEVNGVSCGLLICYDVRFPELYREYVKEGVQVVFHSFYNARQKSGAIHPIIMPITAQARAATNGVFVSLTNSCAKHSWPCYLITPDGLIADKLPVDEPGILISDLDTTKKYYDASRRYRLDAINGKLNSGETVNDARSADRTGL